MTSAPATAQPVPTPRRRPGDEGVPRTFTEATEALRETLPGYEDRPEQVLLAEAIEAAWRDGTILVGQAGTGTGKSLAALIPSILSGERTVYSTATKALQSQIVGKDLPFLAENLGVDFTYAMLQGRSNYVCHQRASENTAGNPVIADVMEVLTRDDEATDGQDFSIEGLRDTIPVEIDNSSWRSMTISTADECLGKSCVYYSVCRFAAAKGKAASANVVVANHALVAIDGQVRMQTDGLVDLLGNYDHLIVDECHELEEYVTSALEHRQTVRSYNSLAGEVRSLFRAETFGDDVASKVVGLADDIAVAANTFFTHFEAGRVRHRMAVDAMSVVEALMVPLLGLRDCFEESPAENFDDRTKARMRRAYSRLNNLLECLQKFVLSPDNEIVRLFEEDGRGNPLALRVVPVTIAEWCREALWSRTLPTLISATVLVDGKADYVANRLGFTEELETNMVDIVDVGSPFDFDRQSRLYIPEHISPPTPKLREKWQAEMHPLIEEMVRVSEGRALLLFTSRRQMDAAWADFAHRIPHPTRKQGDLPNAVLTNWFREETHSVLFATRSFFTGIDIQGESLSLVVIDKLPFPVPTDPVFEARSEDVERRGGNSFSDLTIPMMSLTLQQAFGRLIRTRADRGVVAIMDSRIKTKGYGSKIARSLPAPIITDLNDFESFFDGS